MDAFKTLEAENKNDHADLYVDTDKFSDCMNKMCSTKQHVTVIHFQKIKRLGTEVHLSLKVKTRKEYTNDKPVEGRRYFKTLSVCSNNQLNFKLLKLQGINLLS